MLPCYAMSYQELVPKAIPKAHWDDVANPNAPAPLLIPVAGRAPEANMDSPTVTRREPTALIDQMLQETAAVRQKIAEALEFSRTVPNAKAEPGPRYANDYSDWNATVKRIDREDRIFLSGCGVAAILLLAAMVWSFS